MSFLEELGNVNKALNRLSQGAQGAGRLARDSAKTAAQIGGWGTMSDTEAWRIERTNRRMHGDANRAGTYEEMTGRQYDAVLHGAEPIRNPYGFRYNNPQAIPPYPRPGTVYPAGLPASPEASDLTVITGVVKDLQLMNNSAGASPQVLAGAAAEIKDKLAGLTHGKSAIRIDDNMVVPIGGNINITVPARYYSPATLAQTLETLVGVDPKVKAALDDQFAKTAAAPAKSEPAPAQPAAPAAPSPTAYYIEGLPAASGHPAKLYAGKDGAKVDPKDAPTIDQAQVAKIQEMLGTKVDGKWGPETQTAFAAKCKEAGVNPHNVDFTKPDDKELIALMGKLKPEMLVRDDALNLFRPERVVMSAAPAQAEAAPSATFPLPTATDLGLVQHGVTTPAAPLTGVAATPVAGDVSSSFLTALGINGGTLDRQGVYTGNVPLPSSPALDTAALDARVGQYANEAGLVANTGGGNALFTAAAPAFADTASQAQAQALAASVSEPAVAAPAVAVARGVEAAAPEASAAYFEPPPPQGLPSPRAASQGRGGIA